MQTWKVVKLLRWFGQWAHNGQPERAAEAWLAAGFTPSEIKQWLTVGVFNKCLAAFLTRKGYKPADMDKPSIRALVQWFLWQHEQD